MDAGSVHQVYRLLSAAPPRPEVARRLGERQLVATVAEVGELVVLPFLRDDEAQVLQLLPGLCRHAVVAPEELPDLLRPL